MEQQQQQQMQVKNETTNVFDINKICRACLTEKGEMRSVFLTDDSTGHAIILAEMISGISTVQVIFFFISIINNNNNIIIC